MLENLISESDVYSRILTAKVDPSSERAKYIYNGRRPISQVFNLTGIHL